MKNRGFIAAAALTLVALTGGTVAYSEAQKSQSQKDVYAQNGPGGGGPGPRGGFGGGQGQGGPGGQFQGGGPGGRMMMGGPSASMTASGQYLYILQGNHLSKVDQNTLQVVKSSELPPMRQPAGGRPGGFGGGGPNGGSPEGPPPPQDNPASGF